MKASVITPSYNSLKYLKTTLASLEHQDIGFENFEAIIVDDGSNDGTAQYLNSYNGKLNLNPIINQKNSGRAISRNRGIAASNNELIIFLDSDIEVQPDFVRLHLEQQKTGAKACVGKVIFHPSIKKNKFMKYLETRGALKMVSGERIPGKYFRTTNSSVPRKVLDAAGVFDENFIYYGGEDAEIGMRISKKVPVIFLENAVGYNNHTRSLDDTLKIIREYGKYSLPYLLEKFPELKADVKIEHGLKELFYKMICSFPFYFPMKLIAKTSLSPYFIYSYLLMRNYRKGYYEKNID